MPEKKNGDVLITDVLEKAFPGNTPHEKAAFGLILAGVRWAREMDLEDEGYDEDTLREMYQTVEMENETKQEYRSDIPFADTAYRVPLSVVLKKIEKDEERIGLPNFFYEACNNYADK